MNKLNEKALSKISGGGPEDVIIGGIGCGALGGFSGTVIGAGTGTAAGLGLGIYGAVSYCKKRGNKMHAGDVVAGIAIAVASTAAGMASGALIGGVSGLTLGSFAGVMIGANS